MAEKIEPFAWKTFLAIAIIVIAAGGGGIYYLNADVLEKKYAPVPLTVVEGDNVTVNYIGMFGSGIDKGKVFDTSLLKVATDNVSWPKAVSFAFRGDAGYVPLQAHVGPETYGSYTSLITGFWTAMVGLQGNQTTTTIIPPAQGYGFPNPSEIQTFPLVQTTSMLRIFTPSDFNSTFSGATLAPDVEFTDPTWGWPDYILSVNSTAVVVESEPTIGEVIHPLGWNDVITGVSNTEGGNGTITYTNELTPGDVGEIEGTDALEGSSTYYLTDVNPAAGTYTIDFNTEVTGNVLIFEITVVDILPPAAS